MKRGLGEVQQVNFYYTAGINNTGSHMFDLLRFFFGDVVWIEAYFSKNVFPKPQDLNLDGILKFKNGIFATFQSCDVKKYLIFELNCLLEKGRIILKDSGFNLDFYKVKKNLFFSGYRELHKEKAPFNNTYKRNFMVNAVNHLVDCVELNKKSISSGIDGLKVLELIESAIASAKENGRRKYLN
jgi:predicted dehydrogenase